MGRLKTVHYRNEKLTCKYDVNVDKDGNFTTTLPQDVVKQLQLTVDELQKKIKDYEKELTNIEVSKALKKYEFSEDIEKEICNVLSDIDTTHITTIQKCFDFLLEKTVSERIEEIEKEIGYDKTADDGIDTEPAKDSFVDLIIKAQEKYNTKK